MKWMKWKLKASILPNQLHYKFSGLCQYHSLWTPEKKSFAVLNPYGQEIKKEIKRKLVF